MTYQRKSSLKNLPARPFDIVESVSAGITEPDLCVLVTTKGNRDFLTRLERDYQVDRREITKAVEQAFDYHVLKTEVDNFHGGPEHAKQGKKIINAYSRAIRALESLLPDERFDACSFHGRPGRTLTTRECIAEDIAHLQTKRSEWAHLLHIEWKLWAPTPPVLTTMWNRQVNAVHRYISNCIKRAPRSLRQDEIRDAGIYRFISELLQAIYKHPAFDGKSKLNPLAVKRMVDNLVQHPPKRKFQRAR
jgi:hypothetical protein